MLSSSLGLVRCRWFHLVARNLGGTAATDCRGYLVDVQRLNEGAFERHPDWVARLALQWANEAGSESIVLSSKPTPRPARLDILTVPEGADTFYLASSRSGIGLPMEFESGVYRLLIVLEASNAATCRRLLHVEFAGDGDSIEIRTVPLDTLDGR